MVDASVTGSSDVLAYASKFESGQSGVVVINKGTAEQTVAINMQHFGYGDNYYVYTLTGGTDNGDFSRKVLVNGTGTTMASGGPDVKVVKSKRMPVGSGVTITAPKRSVSYILIENGDNVITGTEDELSMQLAVYPNPSSGVFHITLPSTGFSRLSINDVNGKKVYDVTIDRDQTEIDVNVKTLSGIFFLRAEKGDSVLTKKIVLR
jgi:hypothetical protein